MVRGNWQRRVEMASARRNESKRKKNELDVHRQWKYKIQQFLKRLDAVPVSTGSTTTCGSILERQQSNRYVAPSKIHIWVDTVTTGTGSSISTGSSDAAVAVLSTQQQGSGSGNTQKAVGRGRLSDNDEVTGTTVHSSTSSMPGIHRRRTTAVSDRGYIVRGEPTTHTMSTGTGIGISIGRAISMCRSYFYTGQCDHHNRKKGTCRHMHGCGELVGDVDNSSSSNDTRSIEPNRNSTLWHITASEQEKQHLRGCGTGTTGNRVSEQTLRTELQLTNDAAKEYNTFMNTNENNNTKGDVMDLLYHLEIEPQRHDSYDDESNNNKNTVSHQSFLRAVISNAVSQYNLPLACITYVVFDNVLVYDRYRQNDRGLLELSDYNKDSIMAVLSTDSDVPCQNHGRTEQDSNPLLHFTGTILHHIIMFLPDNAITTMELVCCRWYNQIRTTPMIWKALLDRGGWSYPTPTPSQQDDNCEKAALYRYHFCQHSLRQNSLVTTGSDVWMAMKSSTSHHSTSKISSLKRLTSNKSTKKKKKDPYARGSHHV